MYKRAYALQMNLAARYYRVMLIAAADGDDMLRPRARPAAGGGPATMRTLCETGGSIALVMQGDSLRRAGGARVRVRPGGQI